MASFEYAFTITLKPKLYDHPATAQYDLTFEPCFKLLLEISLKNQFTLVAEQTKNYNIHYHGIIVMPTSGKPCMKKFHDSFRGSKLFGFVNIKQITEQNIWIEYISKELYETQSMVNRPPIIYDHWDYIKTTGLTTMLSSIAECY